MAKLTNLKKIIEVFYPDETETEIFQNELSLLGKFTKHKFALKWEIPAASVLGPAYCNEGV